MPFLNEIGIFSVIVIGILLIQSLLSWSIIISKYFYFYAESLNNFRFQKAIKGKSKISEISDLANKFSRSSSSQLFSRLAKEFYILKQQIPDSSKMTSADVEIVSRILSRASFAQILTISAGFEKRLTLLATTSSSAPFIGLLGTVIGITKTFTDIAVEGNAGFNIVAPGIAEALVATAFGIFTALPAQIFYNYYRSKIRKLKNELQVFDIKLSNQFIRSLRWDK